MAGRFCSVASASRRFLFIAAAGVLGVVVLLAVRGSVFFVDGKRVWPVSLAGLAWQPVWRWCVCSVAATGIQNLGSCKS